MNEQRAIVARLQTRPGRREDVIGGLDESVAEARTQAGTLVYTVHRDAADDDVIWFYELYRDEAALDEHRAGPALHALGARMKGMLAAAPQIHRMVPVEP